MQKPKKSSDAIIAMRRKQLAHDQSWRLAESQRDSAVKYVSVTLKIGLTVALGPNRKAGLLSRRENFGAHRY